MRLLVCVGLIFLIGCSASSSTSEDVNYDLKSIALQYHQFVAEKGTPPDSAESLLAFTDAFSDLPMNQVNGERMTTALESGDYVVFWSFDVEEDFKRNGSTILAYHKRVPEEGGYVAYADGSVRSLTKEQFAETKKASDFQ